jgi:predicted transcriptional regulator
MCQAISGRDKGPVTIAGCTTKESIYEDNANRSFLIYIDESKEQDEKIMDYQRKVSAGKIDTAEQQKIVKQLQDMQRILQPVQVRNPFAEFLKIPDEVFKPRRTNAHYLAFVELVTFYHQYQREKKYDQDTGEEYIETTLEDIAEANKLMKEILLRKSDELNGATRGYFEKLKDYLTANKQTEYTNREIRQTLRIKGTTLRRYHNELLSCGMIRVKAGKKNIGYQYEVVSYEEYQKLHDHINRLLDEILSKLQAGAPSVSHLQNGSPKKKQTSKLKAVSQ